MGLRTETSCFLELNRHRAVVLVLRPLEPGFETLLVAFYLEMGVQG